MATRAPHAIVIEPDTYPPEAQPLLEELAERLPEAYARVFVAAGTARNAGTAKGLRGGRLSRVLLAEAEHLEQAYRTVDTAIRAIQTEITRLENES